MKEILLCLYLSPSLIFAQSLLPLNAPFTQGQPMEFQYAGGTGAVTDWIGIYKHGQTPGGVASTIWQYIPAKAGKASFDGLAEPGYYDAHLFCCDGYQKLASYANFYVAPRRLKSRLYYYQSSDSVQIQVYSAGPGSMLALYRAEDLSGGAIAPGAVPLATKNLVGASGVFRFPPLPAPASYVAALFSGTGQLVAFDPFETKPAPEWPSASIARIGIGSCGSQHSPQVTLSNISNRDLDLFIYAGDNLYIDTYSESNMRSAYESFLSNRREFQQLRATVPIAATWDDHDYGCCDEDADYPLKAISKQIFLDFYGEPANSPRRAHEGIYASYVFGETGRRLQLIILDTRSFLSDKRPNSNCGKNDYCPWNAPSDTSRTMLGPAQWAWLKTTLQEPADLRLVVSSVQYSSSYHGFESWTLFPHERRKFQELIRETKAEHLFFVSGDMHYSEVSVLKNEPGLIQGLYPIYDFTASGINQSWPPEINLNRVGNKAYGSPNTGLLDIDWEKRALSFTAFDEANTARFEHQVSFSEMEFKPVAVDAAPMSKGLFFKSIPIPGGLRLVFEEKSDGLLLLYNSMGQALRQAEVGGDETVEINGLTPGIYAVQWRRGQHFKTIKVFVK